MAVNQQDARALCGRHVALTTRYGDTLRGLLLNTTSAKVWLVDGDEDRFVALADISSIATVPA